MATAALAVALPASAGTTTFTDNNLTLSDYTITTNFASSAFTGEAYQGGDPSGGTSFATYYTTTGSTTPAAKFWALSNSFVYDPSTQGAINSIDAAMDQVVALIYDRTVVGLYDARLDIRILAEQGGQLYRSRSFTQTAPVYNTWLSTSVSGITAESFLRLDPNAPFATPSQPGLDFAGGAIRFGFEVSPFGVLVNGGPSTKTTESYLWIDNLTLTLNTQAPTSAAPEPTTWAMMIMGFAAIGVLTRRRGVAVA